MKLYQSFSPYFFILFAAFLVFSCNDDNTVPVINKNFEEVDVVTGLYLYDNNGAAVGKWRQPNVKKSEDVFVYPIPASDAMFVSSNLYITNLWLIKADCFKDNSDNIEELSQDLNYEISQLEPIEFTASFSSPSPNFTIDFTDYEKGFYRLFYEIENDKIYWENLYIDPAATNFPDVAFLDDVCGWRRLLAVGFLLLAISIFLLN